MIIFKIFLVATIGFWVQKWLLKYLNRSSYVIENNLFLNDKAIKITTICSSLIMVVYLFKIENAFDLMIFSAATIILIAASAVDYYYKEIPPVLCLILLVFGVLNIIVNYRTALEYILAGLVPGAIFLILALVSNGGIGGGDIKLIIPLGFILGAELMFFTIVRSYWIGLLILLPMIITKKRYLKDLVAYVPFITIATIVSIVIGSYIKVGGIFI